MAYVILMSIVTGFAFDESTPWSIASGFASVVITIMGVLHLKKQNNDSFGDGFISKYFSLGWVVTFRMLILSIPAVVVFFAVASILGGHNAIDLAGAVFTIAAEILFYWWLGLLFAESNSLRSEQDVAPQSATRSEFDFPS